MANIAGRLGMKIMTIAVGIPIGIASKKAVERLWLTLRPQDPPRKPNEAGVRWKDAIAWSALSSAGVVAADLITRRGAESAWRAILGTEPPKPKTTRAEKNLEQATEHTGPIGLER
jgi:hypothetical protein